MTDEKPQEPEFPPASLRVTDEEVAALASADLDFFPPGIELLAHVGVDEADTSEADRDVQAIESGWRSLIARDLVHADGTFSDVLLSMRAVFATARHGVAAHDSTPVGTWQRTLYVGDVAGLAHGVGPEGIHTFLAVTAHDWADGIRSIVAPDVELAESAPEDAASELDEIENELTRVIKIFGFRDLDDARTSTVFDIVITSSPWLLQADRTSLVPLTREVLDAALAPLVDHDTTANINEETTT